MLFKKEEIYKTKVEYTPYGELFIWGLNANHCLGLDDTNDEILESKKFFVSENIKKYDTGFFHTCYLDNDGRLYGMGNNMYGQIGMYGEKYSKGGVLIDDEVEDFSCGPFCTVYMKKGFIYITGKILNRNLTEFLPSINDINAKLTPYTDVIFVGVGTAVIFYVVKNIVDDTTTLYAYGEWAHYNIPKMATSDADVYFGAMGLYNEKILKIVSSLENLYIMTEDIVTGKISIILYGQRPQAEGYCGGKNGIKLPSGASDIGISNDGKKIMVVIGNSLYEKEVNGMYSGSLYKC